MPRNSKGMVFFLNAEEFVEEVPAEELDVN